MVSSINFTGFTCAMGVVSNFMLRIDPFLELIAIGLRVI